MLYESQCETDNLCYEIVNDGTKDNRSAGEQGNITRTSFASWAKEQMKPNNKVKSANGLRFEEGGDYRPVLRSLKNGEFMIHSGSRHLVINRKDIEDLSLLLREVKDRDFIIEDD
ncbi:hypothetical protein [Cytobacillus gottheilii]|uniref:hypothetical protein n=1 Tax=Cytobacillus gottheilii TaxID=859144 RepID=UPI002494B375|nr:hypothetical protein [Cytobacillus gottheilii]